MPNFGFKDARTSAELLLAPAVPLKRISIDTSGLRLDIGGLANIPGAISGPSQITGAIRGTFGAAALSRAITKSFSGALSATYSSFSHGVTAGATVDPMFQRNTGVSVDANLNINGNPVSVSADISKFGVDVAAMLPGPVQFVQFSTLRPGQTPGFGMQAQIRSRQNQVQGLAQRYGALTANPVRSGVQLLENMNRSPYPLDNELNVPLFPRLSTGGNVAQAEVVLKDKRKFVVRGVRVATGKPGFWSRLKTAAQAAVIPTLNPVVGQVFNDAFNSGGWSEPGQPYSAQYPYNKATQTESGHIFELDDTPAAERIHLFHRAGSFIEMHPNGTVVYKNMRDGYSLTMADQNVKVTGRCNIYVGGDTSLYSKGDVDIETKGSVNVQCKKDFNVFARNINLRSKIQFKADGKLINLRYINLPYQVIPVWGALVPMVNLAALRLDFPTGTFDQVVAESLKGPLDEGTLPSLLKFRTDAEALTGQFEPSALPENPLSNPSAYMSATPAAATYRARFFDTPEECDDFEAYSAHIGLQQTLKDVSSTDDPRLLGGKIRDVVTERNVIAPPAVDYLDFDTFAGTYTYDASYRLGNTSFTLADLVDTELTSGIVTEKKTPLDASVELGREPGLGTLSANTTDLTEQGRLGSGGLSGGLPTQAAGPGYDISRIDELRLSPWRS